MKTSLVRRIKAIEKQIHQKESIPVLFVVQDDAECRQDEACHCISMEQYQAGLLPSGVTENTVILIDDIPI